MKINLAFIVVFALFACEVEENTPEQMTADDFDATGASVLKEGILNGIGGHAVSGTARIYEKAGIYYLVFDPYQSQNGPDLRVYLSRNESATSFISLGLLKSTTGRQSYRIPAGININEFSHVHVWCQQFSVQFGRAMLS